MKKKMFLLENHHEMDIPEAVKSIVKTKWCADNFEVENWLHFDEAYYPENRVETMKKLFTADAFIARHVFVDWCQLEIFIEVLIKFKESGKKISFYIYHPDLIEMFNNWLDEYEAYTTPNTKEFNDSPDLREQLKWI